MIEFWLVRHGETDVTHFNYPMGTKVIYGGYDIPLSENGKFELDQAAKRLRFEHFHAIYSSPLSRCRYGAEQIQKDRDLEIVYFDDLREINRGKWTGLSPKDIAEKFAGDVSSLKDPDFDGHEGEPYRKFRERIRGVIKAILTK